MDKGSKSIRENMAAEAERLQPVRAWQIWANPILIRYVRSRLRLRHLVPWALVVGIVVTFLFLFLYLLFTRHVENWTRADAAKITIIPLFFIQGLLLMLMGTGTVAAGIVQESAEGMVEYQRLTPMTPWAKILGYLFGLPIREYVLASITVPFLLLAVWIGEVPLLPLARYYAVFFSAVVLYHLIGLVAGTVVKKKFLAGRTAQVLVILLYLVLPRFANLGFVFLTHLTILPTLQEHAVKLFPEEVTEGPAVFTNRNAIVPWFQWEFSPTAFSLLIQACLIFVLAMILVRKWRDSESHLLGHFFGMGVYVGILLLLLGNAVPMIDSGDFFPSNRNLDRFVPDSMMAQHAAFGWLTILFFGWALLGLALLFAGVVTPNRHETIRGFRRARKMGWRWVPLNSDDASALSHVMITGLLGVGAWLYFTEYLLASRWIRQPFDHGGYFAMAAAFLLPLLVFHSLLERHGWRVLIMVMLLAWVVPPLVAMILGAAGLGETLGIYIPSVSGLALPFYGVTAVGGHLNGISHEIYEKVRTGFLGALIMYAIVAPWLVVRLVRYRAALYQQTQEA